MCSKRSKNDTSDKKTKSLLFDLLSLSIKYDEADIKKLIYSIENEDILQNVKTLLSAQNRIYESLKQDKSKNTTPQLTNDRRPNQKKLDELIKKIEEIDKEDVINTVIKFHGISVKEGSGIELKRKAIINYVLTKPAKAASVKTLISSDKNLLAEFGSVIYKKDER